MTRNARSITVRAI